MACFTAVIPEVVALHFIKKYIEKKEATNQTNQTQDSTKIKMSVKISWLITMLWGGIFLLMIEHFWHGEIVPYPPFLSAIESGETQSMLNEILLVGGAIDIFVPMVWFIVCMFVEKMRAKRLNLGI